MIRKGMRAVVWVCALWLAGAAWAEDEPTSPTGDAGNPWSACHQAFSSKPRNVAGALTLRALSEQEELIVRSRDGDEDALGKLFEKYREPMRNWAMSPKLRFKYGDPKQAADDLTGTVAEKLTKMVKSKNGRFFPRGDAANFRAWLFKVAERTAIDANKAAAVRANALAEYTREMDVQASASPDPFRDSVDEVIKSDDVVGTLKPSLRNVYVLVMRQGYSQVEAAKILGLAQGTVNAYASEIRNVLTARYGSEGASLD